MSYKREIDATMKASIHLEADSLQTDEKSKPLEQRNEKLSRRIVSLETLELIYMSPSRPGKRPCYP
jgi:hypothetical protein